MYQLRDKKKYRRKINLIEKIAIGIIILLLFVLGVVHFLGGTFHFIGLPIWKAEESINNTLNSNDYLLRTKASVFAENESLKNKLIEQSGAMTDYQLLKSENEQLKSLIGRIPQKHTFTLATVLIKPNRSPYDTLIIDIGEDVGLKGGEQVFGNGETPIGEISQVYKNTSLVFLYSNPGQKTEAVISGSNAPVELIGRGGGNFEMTVPTDLIVDNGTNVILPSIESRIVAVVESNLANQTDAVKKIILRSPINIFELKWVEVRRD